MSTKINKFSKKKRLPFNGRIQIYGFKPSPLSISPSDY